MMTTTTLWAAILGIVLLIAAASMPPYKDSSAMAEARFAYPADISGSNDASAKYFAIRDQQLTSKFLLQDYGFTLLELVAVLVAVRALYSAHRFQDLLQARTPLRSWQVILIGAAAAVATTVAYVFSLMLGSWRDEYPPWADSLGIPLSAVPFLFAVQCALVGSFSLVSAIRYQGALPIKDAFTSRYRPNIAWLVLLGIPPLILAVAMIIELVAGEFVFIIPMFLWVAFFLFWFASKQLPANSPYMDSPRKARD